MLKTLLSRSMGHICKCKQLFWTVRNSLFHKHTKVLTTHFTFEWSFLLMNTMAILWVVKLSRRNTKLDRFLAKNKHIYLHVLLEWFIHCFYPQIGIRIFFAPTGELGQVHIAKKYFRYFLHVGRWFFLLLNLWFSSFLWSKMN